MNFNIFWNSFINTFNKNVLSTYDVQVLCLVLGGG